MLASTAEQQKCLIIKDMLPRLRALPTSTHQQNRCSKLEAHLSGRNNAPVTTSYESHTFAMIEEQEREKALSAEPEEALPTEAEKPDYRSYVGPGKTGLVSHSPHNITKSKAVLKMNHRIR